MVAFLEKSTGSAGFHQIIDFLNRSHICYALTKKPEVCVSFIKQFWRSAEVPTAENGEVKITATIDGHSLTITEGSLRRHLKLDDQDGISSIPNSEIFEQLALMGYHTDSDKLTFQKGAFSPQWRFLIHSILHCLSPKKTAWEQFSSNIATAVICLATNRKYNFSRMIFEHMVSNISSPHKFLMYPRFIQICLDMQRNQLQQHSRTYPVPSLSMKVFNNMKRPTKGFSGQEVALFPTMLDVTEPSTSPSRITSSPSHSPEHSPSPTHSPSPAPSPTPEHITAAPTQPSPTQHFTLEFGLPNWCDRIGVLEDDLKTTKQTYSSAFTKLILRVKKLEAQIKIRKARRRAKIVHSDDEDIADDSSKQGRILSDAEVQEKASNELNCDSRWGFLILQIVIQDQEKSSEKGSNEVSTVGAKKGTASDEVPIVSTAEVNFSTAGGTVTYTRRSAEKVKGPRQWGNAINELEITRDEEIARQWDEEERQRAMEHGSDMMSLLEKNLEKIEEEDVNTQEEVKEKNFIVIIKSSRRRHVLQNYKFCVRAEDFDRQDVEELYRLVKERYSTSRPEGYDLMLWGDLHTLFEPDEEDELWKNQHEYNVISWSLYDFCGIHILLMQNGIAINMMTGKKIPQVKEMIQEVKKKLELILLGEGVIYCMMVKKAANLEYMYDGRFLWDAGTDLKDW
ncbi:hypothetical protein Tco_0530910 [Tanacetum coccineum]